VPRDVGLRLAWEEMDRFAITEEASPFFELGDLELYQGFTIAFIDLGTWKCGMIKKPCTGGCGHLSEVETAPGTVTAGRAVGQQAQDTGNRTCGHAAQNQISHRSLWSGKSEGVGALAEVRVLERGPQSPERFVPVMEFLCDAQIDFEKLTHGRAAQLGLPCASLASPCPGHAAPTMPALQLFVRGATQRSLLLGEEDGVHDNVKVEELQALIAMGSGIAVPHQRLVFGGTQLRRGRRLSHYKMRDGSTIHVLRRVRGGMPASAPRIKMPAGNRMHSSAALRTTDMWSNVIGNDFGKANDASAVGGQKAAENAYEMNQNLMALARLSGASKGDAKRGCCKKCGEIGHLAFQCRPHLQPCACQDPTRAHRPATASHYDVASRCFNMLTGKKEQAGDISSTSSEVAPSPPARAAPRLPSALIPPRAQDLRLHNSFTPAVSPPAAPSAPASLWPHRLSGAGSRRTTTHGA